MLEMDLEHKNRSYLITWEYNLMSLICY